jgi:glycosyltransferase involved in cell wall biosynthesis
MRIGIEVQRLFRPHKHGIEVFALEFIKALQNLDKSNEYFIFVKKDTDKSCLSETENFKIVEFDALSFGDWEQYHLPKKCKEYKIDLLHLTGNTAPLKYSKPYIQTVHDIIYLDKIDFGGTAYQNFGNLYRRFVVPRTARKAKKVATVSNFERERILKAFQLNPDKISTIYNGINQSYRVQYSEVEIQELKAKYKLPEKFILFLGNTAPRKNAQNSLQAFASFYNNSDKTTKLVTPALNLDTIQTYLKGSNNSCENEAFTCPGFIDKEDLPKIYQAATFLLFPSLSEGFGLPIIEAMAMACPVITSNTTSMPEIAGDAAIVVDPHNVEQIAQQIQILINKEETRQELSQKGLERSQIFSWEYTAKSYLDLYKSDL